MSFLTGGNKSWPLHNMMIQLILVSTLKHYFTILTRVLTLVLTLVLPLVLTWVAAGHQWPPLSTAGHHWAPLCAAGCRWEPLGAAGHICANFATCSWEPLTMLNPQFVAEEHGLFGGHKSEDIRTFF